MFEDFSILELLALSQVYNGRFSASNEIDKQYKFQLKSINIQHDTHDTTC